MSRLVRVAKVVAMVYLAVIALALALEWFLSVPLQRGGGPEWWFG